MISLERIHKVEKSLKEMGSDVTVLWETQTVFGKDYKVDIVCNKDKSVYTRGVSTLMKGSFFCQECANERYRNKLNSLTLIS